MTLEDYRLESVTCNLCSSDDAEVYLQAKGWTLVRCNHCGLVYVNPRPFPDELPELYDSVYFNETISSDTSDLPTDKSEIETRIISQTLRVQQVKQYAHPPGRLLDVGCGPGFFLACAAREGWNVYGLDISQWAVDYAQKYLSLEVQQGKITQATTLYAHRFDVITMFHLLEHLPNPLEALRAIKQALREEGIIVVTVPNIGGFEARYYGKEWRGLSIPYHLYHFTPDTIAQMLSKAGFQVLALHVQPSPLVADWIKKLMRMRLFPESNKRKENKIGNAVPSVPQISAFHKVYATTLGRVFSGRSMTVVARKVG